MVLFLVKIRIRPRGRPRHVVSWGGGGRGSGARGNEGGGLSDPRELQFYGSGVERSGEFTKDRMAIAKTFHGRRVVAGIHGHRVESIRLFREAEVLDSTKSPVKELHNRRRHKGTILTEGIVGALNIFEEFVWGHALGPWLCVHLYTNHTA